MLNQILEQINVVRSTADEELDEVSFPSTLTARIGRKRQAQEELIRLKREYIREMIRSAVFIVVTGSEASAFSDCAEKVGTFTGSSDALFEELAEKVSPSLLSGRESTKNLFEVMTRYFEEKAHQLEIGSYNQLQFNEHFDFIVNTKEDFVNLARTAINEQVGGEVVGINAAYSLADKALDRNHGARYTPIALTVSEDKAQALAADLRRLTPRVTLAVAGSVSTNLKDVADVTVKMVSATKVNRKKDQSDEDYAAQMANAIQKAIETNEKAVEDALVQIKKSLAK